MSGKALIPIEQRTVIFYDDEITAVLVDVDGRQVVYIPLKLLCDYLGVNWDGQRQRLRRDPVLTEVAQGTVVITAPSPDGRGGGPQEMLSLPLDYLNGWLFGINANRVKEEIRERLIIYQRECYRALADAFLTRFPETAVTATEASLLQVREMGLAIALSSAEKNFGKIYGELYRKFGVTSYKLLPAAKFAGAMAFLTEWYVNLTG
ncbi:MAG: hypothetical protein GWP17_05065, partial [Aquificales bacterium]|nr:hypothetical protein [Aquificales bacterium]